MKCDYCLRRPRSEGGNGSCVLIKHAHLNGVRESDESAFVRLKRAFPVGCSSFKPGDLRPPAPPIEQEGLF